jgi:hypothetical protein
MASQRKRPRKTKKSVSPLVGKANLEQLRPGMPARDSVQKVVDFTSPQGGQYKILQTNETDAYDPPAQVPKKRKRS